VSKSAEESSARTIRSLENDFNEVEKLECQWVT